MEIPRSSGHEDPALLHLSPIIEWKSSPKKNPHRKALTGPSPLQDRYNPSARPYRPCVIL